MNTAAILHAAAKIELTEALKTALEAMAKEA